MASIRKTGRGYHVDPSLPRVVLNPDAIQSNLAQFKIGVGILLSTIGLPTNLSLRHLAVSTYGLAGACQWSGVRPKARHCCGS